MGVNAIARQLSLPPSSCFKILRSLLADDFVGINTSKGYSLGRGAIAVARRALDPEKAYARVRSRLEEIAQTHSIAIGLWRILPESRMTLIGFAECDGLMRIHMAIGQRVPIYFGALGRAVAARTNPSPTHLKQAFDALRWHSPPPFTEYVAQVEEAKRIGYAIDEGNFSPGVTIVAVTIGDPAGVPRYGLSGIMFSGGDDRALLDTIGHSMIELAQWASVRLANRHVR